MHETIRLSKGMRTLPVKIPLENVSMSVHVSISVHVIISVYEYQHMSYFFK